MTQHPLAGALDRPLLSSFAKGLAQQLLNARINPPPHEALRQAIARTMGFANAQALLASSAKNVSHKAATRIEAGLDLEQTAFALAQARQALRDLWTASQALLSPDQVEDLTYSAAIDAAEDAIREIETTTAGRTRAPNALPYAIHQAVETLQNAQAELAEITETASSPEMAAKASRMAAQCASSRIELLQAPAPAPASTKSPREPLNNLPVGVHPFFDASTAHITNFDRHLLQEWGKDNDPQRAPTAPIRVYNHAHGWWIHCPLDDVAEAEMEMMEAGLSASFITLQRRARQSGCWHIILDSDAEEIDGLPTHDWAAEIPPGEQSRPAMVSLSTSHLSPADLQVLDTLRRDGELGDGLRIAGVCTTDRPNHPSKLTWYIDIRPSGLKCRMKRLRAKGGSDPLIALVEKTANAGYAALQFTLDGPTDPTLATYNHETMT